MMAEETTGSLHNGIYDLNVSAVTGSTKLNRVINIIKISRARVPRSGGDLMLHVWPSFRD